MLNRRGMRATVPLATCRRGKVRHKTPEEAQQAADGSTSTYRRSVYLCDVCKFLDGSKAWHWGVREWTPPRHQRGNAENPPRPGDTQTRGE